MPNHNAYPKEIVDRVIELYTRGYSSPEISKIVGPHAYTVRAWINKAGVARGRAGSLQHAYDTGKRTRERQSRAVRRYTLDEFIFNRSFTVDSAWALGVIYGDGCLFRHKGYLRGIDILGDVDVCKKVGNIFGSNMPVRKRKKQNIYGIRFNSIYLAQAAYNFGLRPKKSHILTWPSIQEELVPHFVRGFLDSDGCITNSQGKYLVLSLRSGSKLFLQDVLDRVRVVTGTTSNLVDSKDNTTAISLSCRMAYKLGKWLWEGSKEQNRGVRKFQRFVEFSSNYIEEEQWHVPL